MAQSDTEMRRPSSHLADQIDHLIADLKKARDVYPVLAEQARLELRELTGRLPISQRGLDYSTDPQPSYSDPTGETVVNHRTRTDGTCDPSRDLDRIVEWAAHLTQLAGSTRRLLNQAPAVTLAVTAGRKPTDGRSAEEHAQRRYTRALLDSRCIISQDHDPADRYGPGQLRRGLCNRHRMAYLRWQEANSSRLFAVDAGSRLVRWQLETFGTVAAADPTESPYKTVKEVA